MASGPQVVWIRMLVVALVASGVLPTLVGCGRKSSLLLERQARGPMMEEQAVAKQVFWVLEPSAQTETKNGIVVDITHASPQYLEELFNNKQIFGGYAGMNPYFLEQLVFYVKIMNRSGKKLALDPNTFVVVDDKGNQYHYLSPDYNNALAEAKAPVGTITRGVLEDARPGYFGVGLPVGKIVAKPQRRFALLKMASLQSSVLHDGTIYDGLIAFWSPHESAQKLRVLITDLKTDFDAADFAKTSLQFAFEFTVRQQSSQ